MFMIAFNLVSLDMKRLEHDENKNKYVNKKFQGCDLILLPCIEHLKVYDL